MGCRSVPEAPPSPLGLRLARVRSGGGGNLCMCVGIAKIFAPLSNARCCDFPPSPASALQTRRWPLRGAFLPLRPAPPPLPGRGLRIPACLSRSPAGPSAKAGGEGEQEPACAIRVG